MSNLISLDTFDSAYSDKVVDQLMSEYDEKLMPLPDFELEPHLLISKVRKHYMEYLIQLLSMNYEKNQKLLNKNIYLPSAIWRCAKNIELAAAQACMVVQIYRKNIVTVIKELKSDIKKGKLNKQLYNCLRKPPENEKKIQVSLTNTDQCTCNKRKRARRSITPTTKDEGNFKTLPNNLEVVNTSSNQPMNDIYSLQQILNSSNTVNPQPAPVQPPVQVVPPLDPPFPTKSSVRESQDSDDLMAQLQKLFQGEEEEDIFDAGYCYMLDTTTVDDNLTKAQKKDEVPCIPPNIPVLPVQPHDNIIESHAAQIKSLDERLASLSGMLASTNEHTAIQQKKTQAQANSSKKHSSSKWMCEEYYLKSKLFELLDEIRDTNRKKLARIKSVLLDLFGEDSDDEGVVSPLDETPEFVLSCKERIAPWVVKLLTPSYIKGRIRGKTLFKAVAKHLIRLIYQCSKYPREFEVQSFVSDFLNNHRMIRCEADFKQFRIENI